MISFKCKISKQGDARLINIPKALHDMILELEGKEILCSLSTTGSKKKDVK